MSRFVPSRVRSRNLPSSSIFVLAWLFLSVFLFAPAVGSAAETLEARLMPLIKAHEGDVAVAVKHLKTDETFFYRENEPMPTASLIKFPVMVEAYRQAEAGTIDLATLVTLKEDDKAPGSGILTTHFSAGLQLSIRDAIRLMIVYSDNTATNLVLDQIGLAATSETMAEWGYPNTKIHAKVFRRDSSIFPDRSRQFGLGSTTASETIRLYEQLYNRQLVSEAACEAMLDHLYKCESFEKISRFLPAGTKYARKGGSVSAARCEAGVIETPGGPIAVCVLTANNADRRWTAENAGNRLCAAVGREVYAYFNPPAAAPANSASSEANAPESAAAERPDTAPADPLSGPPFVTCKAWAVADGKTGELLWGSDEDRALPFASTTKIMTAYLVIHLAEADAQVLDEEIVFSERADETPGSTAGVRAGEKVSVRELLYGLMLPSGNDASVAFGEHFGSRFDPPEADEDADDPLARFIAEMNRTAQRLGMNDTTYKNTHGLTARGHVSTARDLLRLAHTAMQSDLFRQYVQTRQYRCRLIDSEGSERTVVWKNTNELLGIDGYFGVKTGTTSAAGACLVSNGRRGDDDLLIVVLGSAASPARYTDTRNLYRWAWLERGHGRE